MTTLLQAWYPWVLGAHAVGLVLLAAWSYRQPPSDVKRPWWHSHRPPPSDPLRWWLLAVVLIGAAALRWQTSPTPRIYYDEYFYVATADDLAHGGPSVPALDRGLPPQPVPEKLFLPPYPQGWPWLLSLWFRLFGTSYGHAAAFNLLLSVLGVAGLYWALYPFSPNVGLVAAAMLAALPPAIKISSTAAAEPSSWLFIILSLGWAMRAWHEPQARNVLPAVGFLAFAVHMRPENFLYVPLFAPALLRGLFRLPPFHLAMALGLAAAVVAPDATIMAAGSLNPATADHFQAIPRPGFSSSLENMRANLGNNAFFFVSGKIWPAVFTLLAAAGFAARIPRRWFWALWAAAGFLALSAFPFWDFAAAHSYDGWRFSFHAALPLLAAAAFGLEEWSFRLHHHAPPALLVLLLIAVPQMHRTFLWWEHPVLARLVLLQQVSRDAGPDAWIAVQEPELAVALRYGAGARSVSLPLHGPVTFPLYLLATHEPSSDTVDEMDLEPVWSRPIGHDTWRLYRIAASSIP